MSSCAQLPEWVCYFQALAIPILVVSVAIFGAFISMRQAKTAHNKLCYDVFDRQWERRFEVYIATRDFLSGAFDGSISEKDIHSYGLRALEAKFLFDDAMYKYLREIHTRGSALVSANANVDDKNTLSEYIAKETKWIIQQGDENAGFAERFYPFLMQKPGNLSMVATYKHKCK
jgi:hypothetical protein